ncbi:MAG: protein phosphatase CheZ [Candidatus Accumulibacter sp.]|jgi:hypothetical protein|nr:protein phosphatase CheZ [Accumulibacter sp.]
MSDRESSGDSSELEALFDSIADKVWGASLQTSAETAPDTPPARTEFPGESASSDAPPVPLQVREQMRRIAALIETDGNTDGNDPEREGEPEKSLREGAPRDETASFPKETEEHLRRVADLTGQLADKMRDTLGVLGPLCDDLEGKAASLAVRWDLLYANKIGIEEFKRLASDTCMYLKNGVPQTTAKAREALSQTVPLRESGVSASRVARDLLSQFQEFEMRRAGALRKTEA